MSDIPLKYYVQMDLHSGEPIGLYRVFPEAEKPPESLKSEGWVAVPELWYYLSSGEITEADRIDREEAAEIARSWGQSL